ncbi:glycosyltransferase family 2 protein [candidate division NPL-UPA2 bacterium]|nr:glycosyltransferase family 2 protein [candidate division NPL-UPA2 bacterium]
MPKIPISVCIITKNEEKNIRKCLESVKWADEIVVIDSFSTDRTVEICQDYTDKAFPHKYEGQVEQKNFAVSQATNDWILALDADEQLSAELAEEIKKELEENRGQWSGYYFSRSTYYLGKWIRHGGWYPDYNLRLFNKNKAHWGGENPHDRIIIREGKIKRLKNSLFHYYGNLNRHLNTVNNFSSISALVRQAEGKRFRLGKLVFHAAVKFLETYIYKHGFLDGLPGFIISGVSSFYVFTREAKLWELRIKE